ncbi:MAG: hypothetical protein KGS72_26720 [Cyanobacteria bacterium REEB67]|nr:hypothetical protein [Cyanobacteria bacterium REEB67]
MLIVHAHHEPNSFCSALGRRAKEQLEMDGHEVILSDLHALNFGSGLSGAFSFRAMKDKTAREFGQKFEPQRYAHKSAHTKNYVR